MWGEANNIDEQALDGKKAQEYFDEKSIYYFILNLIYEKAKRLELNIGVL